MKTGFLRLILLAVSVLMTGAAPIAAQQKGQKVPDGVFFKIEKKGQQPSYALGTVHYVHGDYMHEIPGLDSILGTITFSPMNYCYRALNGGTENENLINVVKALVAYSDAASEYFTEGM